MEAVLKEPAEKLAVSNVPPGKALYDKWRGQWTPTKVEYEQRSNNVLYLEWTFERLETKPNRTGIPLSERQYQIFNDTHFMPLGRVPTEILYPTGTTDDVIFYQDEHRRWYQRENKATK